LIFSFPADSQSFFFASTLGAKDLLIFHTLLQLPDRAKNEEDIEKQNSRSFTHQEHEKKTYTPKTPLTIQSNFPIAATTTMTTRSPQTCVQFVVSTNSWRKGRQKLTAVVVSLEWRLHALLRSTSAIKLRRRRGTRSFSRKERGGTTDRVRLRIVCLFLKFGFENFISLEPLEGSRP